jgi:ankyrin repeat protein
MRHLRASLVAFGVVAHVVAAYAVPASGHDMPVELAASSAPADGARARAAITRALPLLQQSADTWFKERRCSSCHHQGLGMMTVSLARDRGFAIDAGLLSTQVTKTGDGIAGRAERLILGEASINEAIGQSYRLVGLASTRQVDGSRFALVAHMLAGKQHVSGKWSSYSHRPPLEDGEMTATALTVRAVSLFAPAPRGDETRTRIERARAWLASAPVDSTEDAAMQILGLVWSGAPKTTWQAAARRLKAAQQSDGGWTQIPTRSSDAYATGQVVVALTLAGELAPADPATRRAVAFLLTSQQGDGSWLVTTRRARQEGLEYFDSGFPHGKHQFISYAGAAWATMALLLARTSGDTSALVGDASRLTAKAPTVPTEVDTLPPLLRAALLGSVAEVSAQLAAGADPNTTTENGLTPLMCAAHDAGKVQVLLTAGARPDMAAKSGHTALVVAAGYDGAAASVDRLLAAGAPMASGTSTGVIRGSTPLARAVLRGDGAMVRTLAARGASVHGSKTLAPPLHLAAWLGDVPMTTLLLDLGARIDEPFAMEEGPSGQTPLMVAADSGNLPLVRLLMARGANVNLRDPEGLTPLMIAASATDRGSEAIVRALIAAGADPRATLPDGTTARKLAERYALPAPLRALSGFPP